MFGDAHSKQAMSIGEGIATLMSKYGITPDKRNGLSMMNPSLRKMSHGASKERSIMGGTKS